MNSNDIDYEGNYEANSNNPFLQQTYPIITGYLTKLTDWCFSSFLTINCTKWLNGKKGVQK